MPPKKKITQKEVKEYTHEDKRKNNPPAGLAEYNYKPMKAKTYNYDPHLSPQLVWADKPGLKSIEVEDEAGVTTETVSLHIHERISPHALIQGLQKEEPQINLFADPQLPFTEAVKFYEHDMPWTNRLILGDSLLVANSMIEREMMAGKVQMIYIDPPYGVKYSSNFQAKINSRDVKDGDEHLTREPEQIKAFRDTWNLGIHSYLTYMRDRLRVCRELLTESGSCFVQIGDENVHLVRCLMDEVFGAVNFVSIITFRKKTMQFGSKYVEGMSDYLIFYAKNVEKLKFRHLFIEQNIEGYPNWINVLINDNVVRKLTIEEWKNHKLLPNNSKVFRAVLMRPSGFSESMRYDVNFEGKIYKPAKNGCWSTNENGMQRLIKSNRVFAAGENLYYTLFHNDYPVSSLTNLWSDMSGSKRYSIRCSNS